MKLAVDVYYHNDRAKVVGGLFNEWTDSSPSEIISTYVDSTSVDYLTPATDSL